MVNRVYQGQGRFPIKDVWGFWCAFGSVYGAVELFSREEYLGDDGILRTEEPVEGRGRDQRGVF